MRCDTHERRWRLVVTTQTVLANAGFLLLELGLQYEEGFALLRRAVEENPNNAGVLTNIGIAWLLAGDLAEGETYLQRAIRLQIGLTLRKITGQQPRDADIGENPGVVRVLLHRPAQQREALKSDSSNRKPALASASSLRASTGS